MNTIFDKSSVREISTLCIYAEQDIYGGTGLFKNKTDWSALRQEYINTQKQLIKLLKAMDKIPEEQLEAFKNE